MFKPLGAISREQVESWPPMNREDAVGAQGQKVTLVPVFLTLANKVQRPGETWNQERGLSRCMWGSVLVTWVVCLSGLTWKVSIYEFFSGQTPLRPWTGVGLYASLWQVCMSAWAVLGCTWSCPHQTWGLFYCILHSASGSFPELLFPFPGPCMRGPAATTLLDWSSNFYFYLLWKYH